MSQVFRRRNVKDARSIICSCGDGVACYADGLRLHQLRHSSATHLGEANVSANVIMAKTGHKTLRSVQRYVKPGLAAVHAATETLSSARRRG